MPHKKLMGARLQLQASSLKKTGQNKFAGYEYFELGDFLPTVQRIFAEIGLCGVVSYTADIATLTITDVETGKSLAITSPMGSAALKGCHEVQNIGAVETYQRRYLWVTAMEIVEHDALDATTGKDTPKSAGSVSASVLSTMSEEAQEYVKSVAMDVLACLPDEIAMYEAYEAAKSKLDVDEQVAFWKFFDSKSRAALKRAKETTEKKAA